MCCVVVTIELHEVVTLNGFGEFVEELDELGGRLVREIDRQAHEWQIVGCEHGGQRFLCETARRACAF